MAVTTLEPSIPLALSRVALQAAIGCKKQGRIYAWELTHFLNHLVQIQCFFRQEYGLECGEIGRRLVLNQRLFFWDRFFFRYHFFFCDRLFRSDRGFRGYRKFMGYGRW